MARMPDAEWVGPYGSTKMERYDIVCIHTIVGKAPAHAAHFSTSMSGHIYQSRDTAVRSAANLYGNHRIIAVENADMPPTWATNDGHAVPEFTAAQCEAIARIIVWAHRTHGIPINLCPDSKPGSRGIAYHRQGVDGNFKSAGYRYGGRVAGGELWSSATGKVCPGDARIDQIIRVIIPRARQLAGLYTPSTSTPSPEEDDDVTTVMWFDGYAAYAVRGGLAKHLTRMEQVAALKFTGAQEVNPVGPDIYETYVIVDGPHQNTIGRRIEEWGAWLDARTQAGLQALAGDDVDEQALAAALAPLLTGTVSALSDTDLAKVAKAVNDEAHRRSAG